MTGTANYDVILKQQGKNNTSCSSFSVSMTSISACPVSKLVLHFSLFILVYLMAFCGFYICSMFYLNFTLVIDTSISTALTLFLYLLVSGDTLCSSLHEVDLQVFPSKLGWLLNPLPIFKGNMDRVIACDQHQNDYFKVMWLWCFFKYINWPELMASKFILGIESLCGWERCWINCSVMRRILLLEFQDSPVFLLL